MMDIIKKAFWATVVFILFSIVVCIGSIPVIFKISKYFYLATIPISIFLEFILIIYLEQKTYDF